MKPIDPHAFDRKQAEAAVPVARHDAHMIRVQMNRSDWLILATLAVIWGGAFFFIGVAVRHVPPLTYVWLRLTIAAAAMWLFLAARGQHLGLPRQAWGSILLLALLNNALPFTLFGWGQTHIASGLASILNATTPIWGVVVAHVLTRDERMSPRKLAGVLLGFGGVALMIGPSLFSSLGGGALAELACVTASLNYALAAVWARRFRRLGISPLSAWAAIGALALLCTAFGYVLYFKLIDSAGATNALLVTLLVPPVAILLGGLLLGEQLEAQDFIGLALIALGLAAIDGRLVSLLG